MFSFSILTTAIAISAVAAYYSIVGLATIFAAAFIPVVIMGSILEIGKLVTVTFLHRHWQNTSLLLKTYLTSAVVVLMFITSMGIFGFLSKAHIEQTATAGDNTIKIERLVGQIQREQRSIADAETVLLQLDGAVQTLIDFDRIRGDSGAIATRERQADERSALAESINASEEIIDQLQAERETLSIEQNAIEAEVGPIKYIAEFVYGEADKTLLDKAVRWVIIIIVSVFDPLAVALLIAWNDLVMRKKESQPPKPNPQQKIEPNRTLGIPDELKEQGYFYHAATNKVKKRQE